MAYVEMNGSVFVCPYEDLCGEGFVGGEVYSVDRDIAHLIASGAVVYAREDEAEIVWHGRTKWWRIPFEALEVIDNGD